MLKSDLRATICSHIQPEVNFEREIKDLYRFRGSLEVIDQILDPENILIDEDEVS